MSCSVIAQTGGLLRTRVFPSDPGLLRDQLSKGTSFSHPGNIFGFLNHVQKILSWFTETLTANLTVV